MITRPARNDELSRVYRLTYDVTSGMSVTRHVVSCKRDWKLRSGTQFVLEADGGEFVSTLTTYIYRQFPVATVVGIANLFTPAPLRHRSYASRLVEGTVAHYDREGQTLLYLLSDIGGEFYARFGFRPLSLAYEGAPECLPMLRCPPEDWERLSTHVPFLCGLMAFVD